MRSVREHYDEHLSALYSWMAGGVDAAMSQGRAELDELAIHAPGAGQAVDLGAGFGMHSIPLAERGFKVLAVDSSAHLLGELLSHSGMLPVEAVEGDLLAFRTSLKSPADLIVCLGDTLTHLPDLQAIEHLAVLAAESLRKGGRFIITFRDYSVPLVDEKRFIALRSDERRILTCFLEFFDAHVQVHDLLHEKAEGGWSLRSSCYRKLRVFPNWFTGILESAGFSVACGQGARGMVRVIATRS
jgi:SAM-dependent methyltransferase